MAIVAGPLEFQTQRHGFPLIEMPDERSAFELEAQLRRAVARNAELIVAMRHVACELHKFGNAPGHQAVRDWQRCLNGSCRTIRDAITRAGLSAEAVS